jgi:AraC-like DNA-binding protein
MSGVSPLVRSGTLFGYADLSDAMGLNTDVLLTRVGLNRAVLEDPDYLLPVDRARSLLEATSRAPGAESFGLRLGARRRLANLGIIGLMIREEPTALSALQTLCRYLQLVTSSLFIAIDESEQVTVIREDLIFAGGTQVRQSMELALAVMGGILSELIDPGWKAQAVHFRHRAPVDLQHHRRIFRCPLHFNAEFNGIVCASADLQRQLPNRDSQLGRFVQASLDKSLALTPGSDVASVRRLIVALLPLGQCDASKVASHLRMSSRSLHRMLSQHGLSFSTLLMQIRRDLVMQQLRDGDRPITEIAQMLAFESSSAFAHWFQKAFGTSARTWRAQQQSAATDTT